MAGANCTRCGAGIETGQQYTVDGQPACALCYALWLSSAQDRPALIQGADEIVRIDDGSSETRASASPPLREPRNPRFVVKPQSPLAVARVIPAVAL